MGRIVNSIELRAPVEKVFAFYADFGDCLPKIFPKDAEGKVEKLTKGPIGLGTIWRVSGVIGGRKFVTEDKFVEFEENRRVRWRDVKGGMKRWEGLAVFESTDKGTKLTETVDYELPYSVLGKLIEKLKVGKDIESFWKVIVENFTATVEEGSAR